MKLWSWGSFFRTTQNVSGPAEYWTKSEIHFSFSTFSILQVTQPGHDIFSDPFRKPNQNLLLQDITCFLPDMVVVLQLIRVNHQSKLLHHLIPESVTSRMQASEYASLMFSCCDFQRVLLKVYWQAKWFLWCIKSNVQDCYTLCECFFQNLSAKPLWGYSSFRNMQRRRDSSLPSLFCYLPGSEERGNPFRGLNHKLAKTEKCEALLRRVWDIPVSLEFCHRLLLTQTL